MHTQADKHTDKHTDKYTDTLKYNSYLHDFQQKLHDNLQGVEAVENTRARMNIHPMSRNWVELLEMTDTQ